MANSIKHNQSPSSASLPLRLLVTATIMVVVSAANVFGATGRRRCAETFAEVEIVLSDQLSLADIMALLCAPDGEPQVLDGGGRVRVQLSARRLKTLVRRGAEVTVLRKFMLVQGGGAMIGRTGQEVGPLATCSGPYRQGSNDAKVWIPDASFPYCGSWVFSDISISTAPGGAVVSCIDVHYQIIHTYVGDLVVDLSDSGLTTEYNLWDNPSAFWADLNETETGITAFVGEAVNQEWLLWASDCWEGDIGFIDSWWIKVYYAETATPANDDCADAIAVADGVPYAGSTVGATQDGSSSCGFNDTRDVWHSYTAPVTGTAIISLAGSTFDTTLALFDGCGGTELACNDDDCVSLQSEIITVVAEASTYLIRIAGYDGASGGYTLVATTGACATPYEPNDPRPVDGANDVPLDTVLSWDGGGQVQAASGKKSDRFISKSIVTPKGIYGDDDRLDEYEVTDPNLLAVGDATVAIVSRSQMTDNSDGTFSLPTETYAQWYELVDPIATGNPLCSDEPYRDQPNPAWCSGFLVAPDTIATAGHCACADDCADLAFVFGFAMVDACTPTITIDESQIYYCSQVIASRIIDTDWALVRLDRAVADHNPLALRTQGKIADGEDLLVIGHPVGLPRKYADGATVRDNSESAYFQANLDTYGGNSGSPVFNTNTLEVEGLLVRGNPDFVQDGACDRSYVCPDTGCPLWENVTRATEFAELVPVQSYDVYLDTNDPPVQLLCSDINVPVYESLGSPTSLNPCTTYYWQVIATNSCGQTAGPIWSFNTATIGPDFDEDCDVDFRDLANLVLYWLADEPSVNLADPDDIIDLSDFTRLAERWRWSPAP